MAATAALPDPFQRRSLAAGDLIVKAEPWVWSFHWSAHETRCANCFSERKTEDLQRCSVCQFYRYCDTTCQRAGWKRDHKLECPWLRRMAADSRAKDTEPDHDCRVRGCRDFGCGTISFLLVKIVLRHSPFQRTAFTAGAPPMTAMDTLTALLPYDANFDQYRIELQPSQQTLRNIMTGFGGPANRVAMADQMSETNVIYRRILFHAFALGQDDDPVPFGAGLFPAAPHRAMTPVCWDANARLHFNLADRRLHVRALEPIANFTTWADLRYDYWNGGVLMSSRAKRLHVYWLTHCRHCRCAQCSDEKEGEMNPLRCSTQGCSQRIPSDRRARQPCPECGAVVADRLEQLRGFMARHEELDEEGKSRNAADEEQLLKDLDAAGILHPDAHFRLVCGWRVAGRYMEGDRFAEAWALLKDFAACARACFPKYHQQRKKVLVRAAQALFQLAAHEQHALRSDLALGKGFLEEARNICWTLNGRQSDSITEHVDGFLKNWPAG